MNDTAQNTALTVHEGGQAAPSPVPKTPLMAGATPKALVPVDFDGAYRIANVVHRAGMAPASLKTLEQVMVAILHGLEVGLTPMNALQSIAVINGRPTIWGDGAIGLIRASGLLEYMKEYYIDEDKPTMKAVCVVKRRGETEPVTTDFSMADAAKAGLLGKAGPWQTYPKRMLKMRARWALRDTFSDVLKGLSLREEVEDHERSKEPDHQPKPTVDDLLADVPDPTAKEVDTKPAVETEEVIDEYTGEVIGTVPKRNKVDPITSGPIKEEGKAEGGFPGDTPMKAAAAPVEVDSSIPLKLDRKLTDPERDWLLACDDVFKECHDGDSLDAEQESVMLPSKDVVSEHAWARAMAIMQKHRIRCG